MTGFQYDPHAFDLMNELFTRQQDHMNKIGSYVQSNCEASGAFGHGILSPLQGHYTGAYNDAHQGMQNGATIASHCASKIGESKQQVLDDDKSAYDKMAALSAKSGHPLPPWHAPEGGSGSLGEGEPVTDNEHSGLRAYLDAITAGRVRVEPGAQAAGRGLTDPYDPLKPSELTPDQWLDPKTVIRHLLEERQYNARMQHYQDLAANDPGGHDASYFQRQAELNTQTRFESGFASGQHFAQDHLNTTAGSQSLHESPWGNSDGRETLSHAAETPGQLLNIATALPATIAAGEHLNEAQQTSAELSQTASGPSNTGSYDWASTDNKGGEW